MLTWIDRPSMKLAKPRADITLSVTRWSRLWGWRVDYAGCYIARGMADTAREAKHNVELAWNAIIDNNNSMLLINPPTARRPRAG